MKSLTLALFCLVSAGVPLAAGAADAAAGKQKGMKCISCHGLKGMSSNPQFPNIAGQREAYLLAQMEAFKSGARKVPAKTALFGSLTSADFADMAAFYAGLPAQPISAPLDAALVAAGSAKYAGCAGCHGAKGEGGDLGPRVAGQHAAYALKRLNDYKSGAADNAIMKGFVSGLSDDDLKALAEYGASLK